MKTIRKTVLIWYSPAEMYNLVTDVASYPQFLPWCSHARVVQHTADGMVAEIGIAMAGIRQTFSTRNVHVAPSTVDLKLEKGPFSALQGHWHFEPLGNGSQRACRIHFTLQYGFASAALAALVGPVFDRIASTLVQAFMQRAKALYG